PSPGILTPWPPLPSGVLTPWPPLPSDVLTPWPPLPSDVLTPWPPLPSDVLTPWPPLPSGEGAPGAPRSCVITVGGGLPHAGQDAEPVGIGARHAGQVIWVVTGRKILGRAAPCNGGAAEGRSMR